VETLLPVDDTAEAKWERLAPSATGEKGILSGGKEKKGRAPLRTKGLARDERGRKERTVGERSDRICFRGKGRARVKGVRGRRSFANYATREPSVVSEERTRNAS